MNHALDAVPRLPQRDDIQSPATQNIITLDTVWKKYKIYKNSRREDAGKKNYKYIAI